MDKKCLYIQQYMSTMVVLLADSGLHLEHGTLNQLVSVKIVETITIEYQPYSPQFTSLSPSRFLSVSVSLTLQWRSLLPQLLELDNGLKEEAPGNTPKPSSLLLTYSKLDRYCEGTISLSLSLSLFLSLSGDVTSININCFPSSYM